MCSWDVVRTWVRQMRRDHRDGPKKPITIAHTPRMCAVRDSNPPRVSGPRSGPNMCPEGAQAARSFATMPRRSTQLQVPLDVTTSADRAAHSAVVDILVRGYPDHPVRGEDGDSGAEGSEFVWYVDALDGTANYAAGIPHYYVSVGLRHNASDGTRATVAAAVHDPVHDGSATPPSVPARDATDGTSPSPTSSRWIGPSSPPRSSPPPRTFATAS